MIVVVRRRRRRFDNEQAFGFSTIEYWFGSLSKLFGVGFGWSKGDDRRRWAAVLD